MKLFYETYGDINDPAVLLNAGAGMQCLAWPEALCFTIAAAGFFVIRYDYRDTGFSPRIDYSTNPYTIDDMVIDALEILDKLKLNKAHFVGYSLGGILTQLAAIQFPHRLLSATLISATSDLKPGFDACAGLYDHEILSSPEKSYIDFIVRPNLGTSNSQKLADSIINNFMLDGNKSDFKPDYYQMLFEKSNARGGANASSHNMALSAVVTKHRDTVSLINLPTFIIHGAHDPLFPVDHAHDLAEKIVHSQLHVIADMGHIIGPRYFDEILEVILKFLLSLSTPKK